MKTESIEMDFGQEFLPNYPDSYIAEDLPKGGNLCPHCSRSLLHLKGGKVYCTHCYLQNRKDHGSLPEGLKESDREFLLDFAVRKIIEDALDPDHRPGTIEDDMAYKFGRE